MKKSNFIHELYPQGTVLSFLFDKRKRKKSIARVLCRYTQGILNSAPEFIYPTPCGKNIVNQNWNVPCRHAGVTRAETNQSDLLQNLNSMMQKNTSFFLKSSFVRRFHCSSELCNCSVRNGIHNEPLFYGNFLLQDLILSAELLL